MWTQASAPLLLLLLACCVCTAEAQSDGSRRQSIWDDPIKSKTKANDLCTMIITGQGEHTRLRLSCQSTKQSYWCEYVSGASYNKNHYFVQMMWGLRKLHDACQAPRHIKPHMCRKATDDSQMVFFRGHFKLSGVRRTKLKFYSDLFRFFDLLILWLSSPTSPSSWSWRAFPIS
ncbi:hypothetical protein JOB18_023270 [Solea senegalensis]|uniref:Fibroblast growth factor binding protein 2a n=1 Tax=Solea senegalensis TaxID=28829 RepID=A0AAV6SKM7_SOLSE|nr:hypothetical protein JOB18_023270 [Solea senegalensis]